MVAITNSGLSDRKSFLLPRIDAEKKLAQNPGIRGGILGPVLESLRGLIMRSIRGSFCHASVQRCAFFERAKGRPERSLYGMALFSAKVASGEGMAYTAAKS